MSKFSGCVNKVTADENEQRKILKALKGGVEKEADARNVDEHTIEKEWAARDRWLEKKIDRILIDIRHDKGAVDDIINDLKDTIRQRDKGGILEESQKHLINATRILSSYFETDPRQVKSGVNVESVKSDFEGIVMQKIGYRLLEKFNRSFRTEDSLDLTRALFDNKNATPDAIEYIAKLKAGYKEAMEKILGDKPNKRELLEKELDHALENLQFDNRVEILKLTEDDYVKEMRKYLKSENERPGIEARLRTKWQHYHEDRWGDVDYSVAEDFSNKHILTLKDFKGEYAYVEYITKFNNLTSVVAAIQNQLVTTSYKVGLYKIFGSNPQKTLNKIFAQINDNKELSNLVKRSGGVNELEIRGLMDIVLGRDISVNAMAKYLDTDTYKEIAIKGTINAMNHAINFNRKILTKLKYGHDLGLSATTQALGDSQVLAFGRAINNIPNNGTFSTHLRMIANLDGETRKELLKMGTPLDYYMSRHAAISAREGDNVFASRNVDMITSNVHFWNTFEKTGLAVFDAASLQANQDIAMNAMKQWSQLDKEYQSFFARNGWTEATWNKLVDSDVRMKGENAKYAEMMIDDTNLPTDIRDLYRATVINSAKFHSGRPTLHLRNTRLKFGGPIGTGKREIVDMFMYLQSFAITQMVNHIGNIVFNGGAGIKNVKMQNVAFWIGIGVGLHYLNFQIKHALLNGEFLDITNWDKDTKEGQAVRNGFFTSIGYGAGLGFAGTFMSDTYTWYGSDVKKDFAGVLGTPQTQNLAYVNPIPMFTNNNLYNDTAEILFGDNNTDEDKMARRNAWRGLTDFGDSYVPRAWWFSGAMTIIADTELQKIKEEGISGYGDSLLTLIH